MIRRPPRSTRTDTLFPYTTLFRSLVSRLLSFARRQHLETKVVDLRELVGGMSDLIARSVGADIAMEMETSKEVPLVEIDPNQLELALLNLSVNARYAMPEGGTLRIGVNRVSWEDGFSRHGCAPANYVVISVEETGTERRVGKECVSKGR